MNDTLEPGVRKLLSVLDRDIISQVRDLTGALPVPDGPLVAAVEGQPPDEPGNIVAVLFDANNPQLGWSIAGAGSVAAGAVTVGEHARLNSSVTRDFVMPAGAAALVFTLDARQFGSVA